MLPILDHIAFDAGFESNHTKARKALVPENNSVLIGRTFEVIDCPL
jgi:hypothetical protein